MAKNKGNKTATKNRSPGKLTPAEAKNAHNERMREISEQYKLLRYSVVGVLLTVSFCCACYCAMQAAASLAGKQTDVNAAFKALAEMNLSAAAGYALAAIFGSTTFFQWRGRKKAERAAARVAELEKLIDPDRKGSGLTSDGENPEGDGI